MKQLENSIRKATMTCYATEGVYPPTLEYLKKNYGIQIDESRFTVFYEVFAKNLMPEIVSNGKSGAGRLAMKRKHQRHSIENVFVLVLFAIFAIQLWQF